MHLPKMHECGLVLSAIHLQLSSIGLLDDSFDNGINELARVQAHRDAVANFELGFGLGHVGNVRRVVVVFK